VTTTCRTASIPLRGVFTDCVSPHAAPQILFQYHSNILKNAAGSAEKNGVKCSNIGAQKKKKTRAYLMLSCSSAADLSFGRILICRVCSFYGVITKKKVYWSVECYSLSSEVSESRAWWSSNICLRADSVLWAASDSLRSISSRVLALFKAAACFAFSLCSCLKVRSCNK
jgi:hypothetical protein